MNRHRSSFVRWSIAIFAVALSFMPTVQAETMARPSPDWVRDGVVYELFPRNFSAAGNFNAISDKLDELKNLGVTILWLMPVNPSGKEKSKGTLGSPYAVKDYYAINPDYGTEEDLKKLVAAAHQGWSEPFP